MARIAVLGATGGTGRAVARLALEEGHDVTVLVRDPARLGLTSEHLVVVVGDALRAEDVDDVVRGQDAVFSSLGLSASGSADEAVSVCTVGIGHTLTAMDRHGVGRLVAMSTHGVNESDDGSDYTRMLWTRMGERLRDKVTMEPLIRQSTTSWTIVRAPRISLDPPRGPYQVGDEIAVDASSSVSHDSLARFVLDELVEPRFVGRALSISE